MIWSQESGKSNWASTQKASVWHRVRRGWFSLLTKSTFPFIKSSTENMIVAALQALNAFAAMHSCQNARTKMGQSTTTSAWTGYEENRSKMEFLTFPKSRRRSLFFHGHAILWTHQFPSWPREVSGRLPLVGTQTPPSLFHGFQSSCLKKKWFGVQVHATCYCICYVL